MDVMGIWGGTTLGCMWACQGGVDVLGTAVSPERWRGGERAELCQGRQDLCPGSDLHPLRSPPALRHIEVPRGGSDAGGVPSARGRLWGGWGSRTRIS